MMASKIILKSDSPGVNFKAEKDGKIRVSANGLVESPAIVLAGQYLEVRWRLGQVVLTIRDLPPNHDQAPEPRPRVPSDDEMTERTLTQITES